MIPDQPYTIYGISYAAYIMAHNIMGDTTINNNFSTKKLGAKLRRGSSLRRDSLSLISGKPYTSYK